MENGILLEIDPQPDDTTCGPTCLHAVYRYHGDDVSLDEVIASTGKLADGGTLAVLLAQHALERGYRATIYTYNLQVFDPTWFASPGVDLSERLKRQLEVKKARKLRAATRAYLRFVELGGKLAFEDLTDDLLRRYLDRSVPILTGLSATFLYRSAREFGPDDEPDDIRGLPVGHFVILSGYDRSRRRVRISDPFHPNPVSETQHYEVDIDRVIGAIFLGTLTYDGNLLVLERERER